MFIRIALLVLSTAILKAATISNFSGSADDFYGGMIIRFDLDPVDTNTPSGVDSIQLTFTDLPTSPPLFTGPFNLALINSGNPSEGLSNGATEIINPTSIIIDIAVQTSPRSFAFLFPGVEEFGVGIEEELIVTQISNGSGLSPTDNTYGIDLIVNPNLGDTPSSLGQQDFLNFASQDDIGFEYLGIPEPSTSVLSLLGLLLCIRLRSRK